MTRLRALLSNQSGATAVEFALLFMLLVVVTFGTVEMGFAFYQWNAAEKATHLGVRRAVVSDPVSGGLNTLGVIATTSDYGKSCRNADGTPNSDCYFPPITCTSGGAGSATCTNAMGTVNPAAFDSVVQLMQLAFPRIQHSNVVISYSWSGLGFVGRPGGQPVVVTVSLRNMTYDFILLDALAGLPDRITMPPFTATLIGEDLSNTTV